MTVKGGFYIHFKGGMYFVTGVATHTETGEELVIYKDLKTGLRWARPASMFTEEVEHEGQMVPRFQQVDEQDV